jgi:hypothetical protein
MLPANEIPVKVLSVAKKIVKKINKPQSLYALGFCYKQ